MADREDRVFSAKLAEQAERYDGAYCWFLVIQMCWVCQIMLGPSEVLH